MEVARASGALRWTTSASRRMTSRSSYERKTEPKDHRGVPGPVGYLAGHLESEVPPTEAPDITLGSHRRGHRDAADEDEPASRCLRGTRAENFAIFNSFQMFDGRGDIDVDPFTKMARRILRTHVPVPSIDSLKCCSTDVRRTDFDSRRDNAIIASLPIPVAAVGKSRPWTSMLSASRKAPPWSSAKVGDRGHAPSATRRESPCVDPELG